MKMLMIIVDESKREELEIFLNRSGVVGYTEISQAAGLGSSGPRLGSSAFPKTSAVVFSMMDEDSVRRLMEGVDEFCSTCGEQLRMVSWDVEVLR
ncbi:MAG: hypothetical protein EP299_07515 [Acidobacteria bacterium]|nr:MAG: hypothetical protein EP299_07515 [Acidobacteriota bacterium]